ncbi:hypothetical protein C8J56DRAFT_1100976 [Mycena floridula]|nr:hypothetical protein C8J56DRAFT_1100976 [Mycena floridula]
MLHPSRLFKILPPFRGTAGISYALLPERTMNTVLEERRKVQGVPKVAHFLCNYHILIVYQVYKDWGFQTDPPPDVDTVRFCNRKLGYHSYNPPEGYTAQEIMRFRRAKKYLTLERAQALIDAMELGGSLGWNLEDLYLQFRDGPGPHDIKRKPERVE